MSDVEAPSPPEAPGPALGREVTAPRPRTRWHLIAIALATTLAASMIALVIRPVVRERTPQVVATPELVARCNPLQVDVHLRATDPPPAERATCLAIAGRIAQARAILDAMSPDERNATVHAIFAIAHPIADAGDDRSAGPIMRMIVDYHPENFMAMFHAGMAAYALGEDAHALRYLQQFLAMYQSPDVWRRRGEAAIRGIQDRLPLAQREAHFPE
jgi:hypothetical protein